MRVERTEPPGAMRYPALAALALVSLVVGSIWWQTRETRDEPAALATTARPAKVAARKAPAPLTEPARAFVAFAGEDLAAQAPTARAATARGMRLLAAAIAARGDSVLWKDRAVRLEEAAARVEGAADSTAAAGEAHPALIQTAAWLAGLPRVSSGQEALNASAEAIVPTQPLAEQVEEIEAFFEAAASALDNGPSVNS
jgi:hypothetical protein